MKANGGNEASVNYWGEGDQEEEEAGLNYYGGGGNPGYQSYPPYGKSNYKGYGKGQGKYDHQGQGYGKGKNGFGFGGKAKGKGKGKDYKGGYSDSGKSQGAGFDKGKGKGNFADKDCYNCGQKGHISRNCPKGKGGMNNLEDAYYEDEDAEAEPEEQVEWLGCLEAGWLGCINCISKDDKAAEMNLNTLAKDPKNFVPVKNKTKNDKNENGKFVLKTENMFNELKEKDTEINNLSGVWEPITLTIDSGAGNNVAPKNAFPWIKLQENDDSRSGRFYTTANGKRVYVLGEKVVTIKTTEGVIKKMKFQIADVTRILASVGKITGAGNDVIMQKNGGKIKDKNGKAIEMEIENGVYVVKGFIKAENDETGASVFHRQGM